jgi:hypothetical protein
VLFTPDGVKRLGTATAERVELRPGVGEWLRQFADVASALKLGMHCGKCGADLTGKNADTDRAFSLSCQCRDFIWNNRDYREPSASEGYYGALKS